MTHDAEVEREVPLYPLPPLEEQADLMERHCVETLLFCPITWELRYAFVNQETGEVVHARCNRWPRGSR